jgi:hypothetical protein
MTEHKKRFEKIMGKLEEKAGAGATDERTIDLFDGLDDLTKGMIETREYSIHSMLREIVHLLEGKNAFHDEPNFDPQHHPEEKITIEQLEAKVRAWSAGERGEFWGGVPVIVFKGEGAFNCSMCGKHWHYTRSFLIHINGGEICFDCGRKVAPELQRMIDTHYECPHGQFHGSGIRSW